MDETAARVQPKVCCSGLKNTPKLQKVSPRVRVSPKQANRTSQSRYRSERTGAFTQIVEETGDSVTLEDPQLSVQGLSLVERYRLFKVRFKFCFRFDFVKIFVNPGFQNRNHADFGRQRRPLPAGVPPPLQWGGRP